MHMNRKTYMIYMCSYLDL